MSVDCAVMIKSGTAPSASADQTLEAGAARLSQARLKRCLDLCGSAFGLVFLAPFLILVALLIRLESSGPAIFKQRRTGYNGKEFTIYKFRTMNVVEDGPDIQQAKRGDQRVTKLGRILRASSVDELPQLMNVLKGEMSLVGPRPHALAHDLYYGSVVFNYMDRFRTKPGITGLAQIYGFRGPTAQIETMSARVSHDLEYIRNWSILLDVKILVATLIGRTAHKDAF